MTELGYERRDLAMGVVLVFFAGLTVSLLVALGITWWLHNETVASYRGAHAPAHPLAETRRAPPEPRLSAEPRLDLAKHKQRIHEQTTSYGWIDREAGRLRIPVARARELVLEEGLPVKEEP